MEEEKADNILLGESSVQRPTNNIFALTYNVGIRRKRDWTPNIQKFVCINM